MSNPSDRVTITVTYLTGLDHDDSDIFWGTGYVDGRADIAGFPSFEMAPDARNGDHKQLDRVN